MLYSAIQELIEDRRQFLQKWKDERLTTQIKYMQRNLLRIQNPRLFDIINRLIQRCLEEKTYWQTLVKQDPTLIASRIDEVRPRTQPLIGIPLIQQVVSNLHEAIWAWGNCDQYLNDILNAYERIIFRIRQLSRSQELLIFTQEDLSLIKGLKSSQNIDAQLALLKSHHFLTEQSSPNSKGKSVDPLNDHPWKAEMLEFNAIRANQFGILKKLTYYRLPQLFFFSTPHERRDYETIKFVINEIRIAMNIWGLYAGTARFHFRVGDRTIAAAISRLDLRPGLKILEVFGNIPVISWLASFLGAESTAVDFHYQTGKGEVFEYRQRFMELVRAEKFEDLKRLYQKEREKEAQGDEIKSDIHKDRIDPIHTLMNVGHTPWLYEIIKDRYTPLNLDLMDMKNCTSYLSGYQFDRFFIDPPYGVGTAYQNPNVWELVKNAISVVKTVSAPNCIGFITVPPVSQSQTDPDLWRTKLYDILVNKNVQYIRAGRNNRLVFIRLE